MRTALALFATTFSLLAAPALAQESPLTGSVSAGIQSEWLFRSQAYNETEDTDASFADTSATVCSGSTCGTVWYGEAGDTSEIDLSLSHSFEAGGFTIDGSIGYFIVDGPEIWDLAVSASRQAVCDTCTVSFSYEGMRGSFVDDAIKVELTYEHALSESVAFDVTAGVAHSSWAQGFALPFEAGATWKVHEGVSARFFVSGYVAGETRTSVGMSLSADF